MSELKSKGFKPKDSFLRCRWCFQSWGCLFNVQPKSIIFFDDGQSNLQSVADMCRKRNIAYKGYQYLAQPNRLPGSWSTPCALKQLDYFIKHKQWLSDKECDLKVYRINQNEDFNLRKKNTRGIKMNNPNNLCKSSGCLETGTFEALDKNKKPIMFEGLPVTFEWCKTTDHVTMVELQKSVFPVVAEAFADEVRNFLLDDKLQIRKEYADMSNDQDEPGEPNDNPEESPDENPFIASARLERAERVEISRQQWEEWFDATAESMKDLQFIYFFVVVKSGKGNILGFTAFYSSPMLTTFFPEFDEYTDGDVVLEPIAIIPATQGLGLARPLIFSILTLAPEIKRILVGTRMWITNAVAMYDKLGFIEYKREGIGVKFKYVVKK